MKISESNFRYFFLFNFKSVFEKIRQLCLYVATDKIDISTGYVPVHVH